MCVFKSDYLSSSSSIWLPSLITWPHHLHVASHNLQLLLSNNFLLFSKCNLLVNCLASVFVVVLLQQCYGLLPTRYNCLECSKANFLFYFRHTYVIWTRVYLFVLCLIFFCQLWLLSGKEKYSGKPILLLLVQEKKFFMKHKAKQRVMIIWHKTCTVNGKKKPWQLVICSLFMHVTKSDLFGAWAKEVNRKIPTDPGFLFVFSDWEFHYFCLGLQAKFSINCEFVWGVVELNLLISNVERNWLLWAINSSRVVHPWSCLSFTPF